LGQLVGGVASKQLAELIEQLYFRSIEVCFLNTRLASVESLPGWRVQVELAGKGSQRSALLNSSALELELTSFQDAAFTKITRRKYSTKGTSTRKSTRPNSAKNNRSEQVAQVSPLQPGQPASC
jgi:hypothetical protein